MYGDREFDLGITTVFGGFTQEFYDEYEKHYPLAKGAYERLEFYRLYLLMIHLLKFGGMYASSVNRSMETILEEKHALNYFSTRAFNQLIYATCLIILRQSLQVLYIT